MKIKETKFKYDYFPELPQSLLDAIDIGVSDLEAGRVIPHREAMRQIREELGLGDL